MSRDDGRRSRNFLIKTLSFLLILLLNLSGYSVSLPFPSEDTQNPAVAVDEIGVYYSQDRFIRLIYFDGAKQSKKLFGGSFPMLFGDWLYYLDASGAVCRLTKENIADYIDDGEQLKPEQLVFDGFPQAPRAIYGERICFFKVGQVSDALVSGGDRRRGGAADPMIIGYDSQKGYVRAQISADSDSVSVTFSGGGEVTLNDYIRIPDDIKYVGGKLYYISRNLLLRRDPEKSAPELLSKRKSDAAAPFYVTSGGVYFVSNGRLIRVSDEETDTGAYDPTAIYFVYDGKLYVITEGKLIQIN
jgi:hypothetical protein